MVHANSVLSYPLLVNLLRRSGEKLQRNASNFGADEKTVTYHQAFY
jgi:hypothetical protein